MKHSNGTSDDDEALNAAVVAGPSRIRTGKPQLITTLVLQLCFGSHTLHCYCFGSWGGARRKRAKGGETKTQLTTGRQKGGKFERVIYRKQEKPSRFLKKEAEPY